MRKTFKNHEIVSIVRQIQRSADQDVNFPESAAKLPFPVQWKKRLNLKELSKIAGIISEEEQDIDKYYTDDEHSYVVKSDSGKEQRRVKNAYITEFTQKKSDLYDAETDVEIRTISPDELSDVALTDLQMDAITFMIEEGKNANRG